LWSTISLPNDFLHGDLTEGAVHLCQLWLQRADNAPLAVDLRLPDENIHKPLEKHQLKVLEEVLSLVFSDTAEAAHHTRSRLRSVKLHAFPQSLIAILRLESLPNLVELKISHTRKDAQHKAAKLSALPRTLRTLALTETSIDLRHIPVAAWPRRLKHLELWQTNDAGLSAERCLTLLEGLPGLESLAVKLTASSRGKGRHRHSTKARALPGVDDDAGPSLQNLFSAHARLSHHHLKRLLVASPPGPRTSLGLDQLLSVLHLPALEVAAFDGCVTADLELSDAEAEGASVGIAGGKDDEQYDIDVAFWAAFERLIRETRATLKFVAFGRLEMMDCEFFESIERGRSGIMFKDGDSDSVIAKEHAILAKAEEFLPVGPTCKKLDVFVCSSSFDEHMCNRLEDPDPNAPSDVEEAELQFLPSFAVLASRLWRELHPNPNIEEDKVDENKPYTTIAICKGNAAEHSGFIHGQQNVDGM
jgi:hypothetical protein